MEAYSNKGHTLIIKSCGLFFNSRIAEKNIFRLLRHPIHMYNNNKCTNCKEGVPNPGRKWCEPCFRKSQGLGSNTKPQQGKQLCTKCNVNEINPGRKWCQQCYEFENQPRPPQPTHKTHHKSTQNQHHGGAHPKSQQQKYQQEALHKSQQKGTQFGSEDWEEVNGMGKTFYINLQTGESQINPPEVLHTNNMDVDSEDMVEKPDPESEKLQNTDQPNQVDPIAPTTQDEPKTTDDKEVVT